MITIAIPCHDSYKTIGNVVNDFKDQTRRDFEVVFWSDGEDKWLKEFVSTIGDDRFRYGEVEDGPHHDGGAFCRDVGLKNACGEYWISTNQDNTHYPTYLEKLTRPLDEGFDLTFCRVTHEHHNNGAIPEIFTVPLMMGQIDIMQCAVRVDLARRIGYRERHREADVAFINEVLAYRSPMMPQGPHFAFIPEVLGNHH